MYYSEDDTIIALSTAPFPSGISVIRISGRDAIKVFNSIFKARARKNQSCKDDLRPRSLITGDVVDPLKKQTIDEALGVIFIGPHSYTGEDTAEIHCHGNPYIARRIIDAALSLSNKNGGGVIRPAERGEFTYRAFINGKIDLIQAEAVLNIIEARSEKSLIRGLARLKGNLSGKIHRWKKELTAVMALVEFLVDMPEEAAGESTEGEILSRLGFLKKSIDETIKASSEASLYEGEIPVVIVGKPNAGKSSLFNSLAREELAIVTPIPGTTRDIISETLHWDGLNWKVSDTAGISSLPTTDKIEEIGRRKALKAAGETPGVVIFVLDGSKPLDSDDRTITRHIAKHISDRKLLIAVNKSDLPQVFTIDEAKKILGLDSAVKCVKISAARGEGIDDLKANLTKSIIPDNLSKSLGDDEILIGNIRQKQLLERCLLSIEEAMNDFPKGEEIAAHHLKFAAAALEELTGETITSDDILGEIFSKFCVGK